MVNAYWLTDRDIAMVFQNYTGFIDEGLREMAYGLCAAELRHAWKRCEYCCVLDTAANAWNCPLL